MRQGVRPDDYPAAAGCPVELTVREGEVGIYHHHHLPMAYWIGKRKKYEKKSKARSNDDDDDDNYDGILAIKRKNDEALVKLEKDP